MHNRIEELQMDLLNCAGLTGVRVVSVKHPARPRDGIHSTALLRSPEGIPWAASVVTGARAFDWDHEQGKVAVEVWRRGPDRKYQRDNAIIYEEAIFAMNLILNEEPNLAAGHAGRVNEVVEQVLANDLKHDRTIAAEAPHLRCREHRPCHRPEGRQMAHRSAVQHRPRGPIRLSLPPWWEGGPIQRRDGGERCGAYLD